MSVRNMPAEAVAGLLSQFEIVGIRVWIDGGWAVDALLGHASRAHGDLDIVVQKKDTEQIRGLLESLGYLDKADADTRPWNFVMGDPAGHEVDVHVIAKTVFVAEESVIIVEGVFLQRPEWRGFLDYCIFLDCPREIRLSRENKAAQANLSKFETRYWQAEDYYLKTVRPAAQADMVIES